MGVVTSLHPQHGYTPSAEALLPRCWDLGLGNRSPNQNLVLHPCTTYTRGGVRRIARVHLQQLRLN